MELVKNVPINFKIKPISESMIICRLKTKATKYPIRIDFAIHIYYKKYGSSGTSIANNVQSIYTSNRDENHEIKLETPKFDKYVKSELLLYLAPGQRCDSVPIGDVKMVREQPQIVAHKIKEMATVTNTKPKISPKLSQIQAAMAFPNIIPKIDSVFKYTKPKISSIQVAMIFPNITPKIGPKVQYIQQKHLIDKHDKVIFVSTWNIKCGIATYTKHLLDELNKLYPNFMVDPINQGALDHNITGKLVHLQHEFGIMPKPPNVNGKVIVTWHTVPSYINQTIRQFESELDIVAHIVHCEKASHYIKTSKDIYIVDHGSASIPEMTKEDARKILNIDDIDIPIGFVFGFQSQNKRYGELENVAENTNIHIIISGAISGTVHESEHKVKWPNNKNVTFLNRYLTEKEIDLYASASDLLLFDYAGQNHYSCSGAMHRTIGAGRPVICSDTKHFSDVTDTKNVLKFNNKKDLERCIRVALANSTRLGKAAREYSHETSWENITKRHIEIYRKYVDL